ncbi:uncharacterized protein LOC143471099 [Clavelina lepadiformis]|uniref:uncharacterized protein LOC143471099 n=1 Tax=Clavelina lepadiformis TaxID=159417 RepID=UPI00404277D5
MEVHYTGGNTGEMIIHNMDLNPLLDRELTMPTKWMKLLELSRHVLAGSIYHQANGKSFPNSISIFLVQQQAYFTPNFPIFIEKIKSNRDSNHEYSIKLIHTTEKIKTSSAVYSTKLLDQHSDVVLATFVSYMVMVDLSTRKSSPFPPAVKNYIEEHSASKSLLDEIPQQIKPKKAFPSDAQIYRWSRKVVASDTDHNGHANNSFYVKLPLECIGCALKDGIALDLDKPIHETVVEKYNIVIQKESKLGEIATVSLYQSQDKCFNFIISVEDKDIANLVIKFF